jgi:hypothetical protein
VLTHIYDFEACGLLVHTLSGAMALQQQLLVQCLFGTALMDFWQRRSGRRASSAETS